MMRRKPSFSFPAIFAGCALCITLGICASALAEQPPAQRLICFAVTDPLGRFVTGLDRDTFEIVQNGVRRPITDFSDVDSPIALAIVSETPLEAAYSFNRSGDELIQTASLSEAVRQLAASNNPRKVLVVSAALDTQPGLGAEGIQVIRANPDNLLKAVVESRSQYRLQFESADASTGIEVVLRQPRGLPPLKVNQK